MELIKPEDFRIKLKFYLPLILSILCFVFFQWNYFFEVYLAHDPSMYLAQSIGLKSCFNNFSGLECYIHRFLDGNTKATLFPVFGGMLSTVFNLDFLWTRFLIIISSSAFLYFFLYKIIRLKFELLRGSILFTFIITFSGLYFSSIFYGRDIFWMFGFIGTLYYLIKNELEGLSKKEKYSQFILLMITLLVRPILTPISFLIPLLIFYWDRMNKTDLKVFGYFVLCTISCYILSYLDMKNGESNYRNWLFFMRAFLFLGPIIYLQKKIDLKERFLLYLALSLYGLYLSPFLYDLVDFFYVSIFLDSAKETLGVFSDDYLLKGIILTLKFYFPALIIGMLIDAYYKKNSKKMLIYFFYFLLMGTYFFVLPKTDIIRFMTPFCLILYLGLFLQNDALIKRSKLFLLSFGILSILSLKISVMFPTLTLPEAAKESLVLIRKMGEHIQVNDSKIRVYDRLNQYEYKWLLELHAHDQNRLWHFEYIPVDKNTRTADKFSCEGTDLWMFGPVGRNEISKIIEFDFKITISENTYFYKKCD
jgi:hypothetical protein